MIEGRHGDPATQQAAPGGRHRFAGFDGIRGVAVLGVILFHSHMLEGPDPFYFPLFRGGWSGVDMFFVLSGFLITGILRQSRDHPRYWRTFAIRRALRILPAYYFILVVIFLLPGLQADAAGAPPVWVYPLFVSNYWIATSRVSLALVVTWSLSIEEQFYLVWPLVVRFVNRRRLAGLCIALIVAGPIVRFFLHDSANEISYMWTHARIDSLAWGALAWIAWEVRSERWITLAARLAPWGMAAWILVLMLTGGDEIRSNLTMAVVGFTFFPAVVSALILGMAGNRLERWTRVFEWRPLAHLGKVSFGAYLLHAPVIIALRGTAIKGNLYLGMLLAVGLTWMLATLMYRVLESPILALKDRLAPY